MQSFVPGAAATLTLGFVNEAGEALQPTSLRWRITDEADAVLQDWTALTGDLAQTQISVTIPGALNILTPPATRGLRTVELEMTTAGGVFIVSQSILLQGSTALAFGVNTFSSYNQALLLSQDLPDSQLTGWAGADRASRERALIHAYERVMQLPIAILWDDSQSILNVDTTFTRNYGPMLLRLLSPAQLAALYKPMLDGLKKAQLVEADDILSGDPIMELRRRGVTQMTTGESSQMFATKPLELPCGPRAVQYVQRWVRFGAKIQRG